MKHHTLLVWTPRILAILVTAYLALFALDAFAPGKSAAQAITDFAIHLFPAGLVLAIAALSWRWPWIGGAAFLLLAGAYAVWAHFRLDWVAAISGPLVVVGTLFLLSWWTGRHAHPA
jgi:uncharacterized membrane protein